MATKSYRQHRIANILKCKLNEILFQEKIIDKRLLNNTISITNVKLSPDLKIAFCYVIAVNFTNSISKDDLITILTKNKHDIRFILTSKIKMKYSPEIRFFYDEGYNNFVKVDNILKKL